MSDLDDLPEPVRDALILLPCMASSEAEDMAVSAVEAELLRLVRENAWLQATLDTLHGASFSYRCYHALKARAERAESELAVIKAKIAEAPTHVAEWTLAYGLTFNAADGTLDGHRVALLDMGKEG